MVSTPEVCRRVLHSSVRSTAKPRCLHSPTHIKQRRNGIQSTLSWHNRHDITSVRRNLRRAPQPRTVVRRRASHGVAECRERTNSASLAVSLLFEESSIVELLKGLSKLSLGVHHDGPSPGHR